MTSDLSRLG